MTKLTWWTGLLLLALGCGNPPDLGEKPVMPWTSDSREATLYWGDGYTFNDRYTFVPSTQTLSAHWSKNGPGGFRSRDGELHLSDAQAAQLDTLLSRIQVHAPEQHSDCWTDVESLQFTLVDASGNTHVYYTDPEKESCDPSRTFVLKDDVQSVLDTCQSLLPEPSF